MTYVFGIIIFLFILGIIVVIHEGGHLLAAKRNGVYCHEFSIGMGPKIIQFYKDKSGTVYNLRAIPLGGYVSIAGEDTGLEIDEAIPKDQRFDNKGKWVRFKILIAGAFMNFVLGISIYALIAFFTGVAVDDPHQITVVQGGVLETAGLETGDYVTEINGITVNEYSDISNALEAGTNNAIKKAGNPENIENVKDTSTYTIEYKDKDDGLYGPVQVVEVQKNDTNKIGVADYAEYEKYHLIDSILYGFKMLFLLVIGTIISLWLLLTGGAAVSDIMGPVGMATATTGIVTLGIDAIFSWLAFLSLAVGAMNILPIPALDGGRILFIIIEAVRGTPIKAKTETLLNNIVFFGLITLMLVVTISDIWYLPERLDYMTPDSGDTVQQENISDSGNIDNTELTNDEESKDNEKSSDTNNV